MLKVMREGAKSAVIKYLLFGMLLLAMTGLALMSDTSLFRSGLKNTTVAKIGRNKITAAEFDHLVQSQLRAQNMKQDEAYLAKVPQQILKQEINNRIFSLAANDMGLQVEDALAAKKVKEIIQPLLDKGMTPKDALQRLLQGYNISESQLVNTLKVQTASEQLLSAISAGIKAPKQLFDDAQRYRHEWRRGEYFTLTSADLKAIAAPTEAELKAYYDTVATQYALPERRTLSVIMLDKNTFGDETTLSDEKLKAYYDENINDYKTQETRTVSQALAKDEAAAKVIYTAAVKSKNLKQAAESSGKDKASFIKAASYTDTTILAELGKAAFAAKSTGILEPIKSPLGWHVLNIEQITPTVTKPFDTVKAEIQKELAQEKAADALYAHANKIDDEIGGGKTVSEVAKENNIKETILDKIDLRGMGVNGAKTNNALPLYDKIVENGFKLGKGMASQLIEVPAGGFMIVGVVDIIPSQTQAFATVKSEVTARWKQDHMLKQLGEKATKITDRLKQGDSFETLAKEFKKSPVVTDFVQRNAPPEKLKLDKNLVAALFALEKTGTATTVNNDDSVTILKLAERKTEQPKDEKKEDREALQSFLNQSLQQNIIEQYRESLIKKYKVTTNEALVNERYSPKEDGETSDVE